jgi:hypothetical protein
MTRDDTRTQGDNAQDVEENSDVKVEDLELSDFTAEQVRGGEIRRCCATH